MWVPFMSDFPNLIECTCSDDSKPVYTIDIGVSDSELTTEEKSMLSESRAYLEQKEKAHNERLIKEARKAFEKLRDIPDMPEEAIAILKNWTTRDGDEDYDE